MIRVCEENGVLLMVAYRLHFEPANLRAAELANNGSLGDVRVFKFCFDPQKVRSLKREASLFRLISSKLGTRDDISRLLLVHVESAPFYLASEYSNCGTLADWLAARGGVASVPIGTRARTRRCSRSLSKGSACSRGGCRRDSGGASRAR